MKLKIIILFIFLTIFNFNIVIACPSLDVLLKNKKWIEHTESINNNIKIILSKHFNTPISPEKGSVYMLWTPVKVYRGKRIVEWREIIWSVHRTNQRDFKGDKKWCFVSGSVAYYTEVKNKRGWPPTVDFLNASETEQQLFEDGVLGLIELRWYNSETKKKHRWFNQTLANYLKWAENYSPISLPRVINSLD